MSIRQQAIGVRLSREVLKDIERLSQEEKEDRSTVIRRLILLGYSSLRKHRAAEKYLKGQTSLSGAAQEAGLTVWDMERYLVEEGFRSDYSIEDLQQELRVLDR